MVAERLHIEAPDKSFFVNYSITALFAGSLLASSTLITPTFKAESHIESLPDDPNRRENMANT
jgi:hypothetical protein